MGLAPTPGLSVFTVQQLLALAGVNDIATVRATGADILVTFYFDCDWDVGKSDCHPTVFAERTDTSGYVRQVSTDIGRAQQGPPGFGAPGLGTPAPGGGTITGGIFGSKGSLGFGLPQARARHPPPHSALRPLPPPAAATRRPWRQPRRPPQLSHLSAGANASRTTRWEAGVHVRFLALGQARIFDIGVTLQTLGSLLWFLSMVPALIDMLAGYLLPGPIRKRFEAMTTQKFTMRPLRLRGAGRLSAIGEGPEADGSARPGQRPAGWGLRLPAAGFGFGANPRPSVASDSASSNPGSAFTPDLGVGYGPDSGVATAAGGSTPDLAGAMGMDPDLMPMFGAGRGGASRSLFQGGSGFFLLGGGSSAPGAGPSAAEAAVPSNTDYRSLHPPGGGGGSAVRESVPAAEPLSSPPLQGLSSGVGGVGSPESEPASALRLPRTSVLDRLVSFVPGHGRTHSEDSIDLAELDEADLPHGMLRDSRDFADGNGDNAGLDSPVSPNSSRGQREWPRADGSDARHSLVGRLLQAVGAPTWLLGRAQSGDVVRSARNSYGHELRDLRNEAEAEPGVVPEDEVRR